jgi:hypothetical protein
MTTTTTAPAASDRIFSFPDSVDEASDRMVARGVCLLATATIGLDLKWMTAVIAYGFVARVLTGPTLSLLGQLATRMTATRHGNSARLVAGTPRRFAQGIGAALSVVALLLTLIGTWAAAEVVLVLLIASTFAEGAFGYCVGERLFALVRRVGEVRGDSGPVGRDDREAGRAHREQLALTADVRRPIVVAGGGHAGRAVTDLHGNRRDRSECDEADLPSARTPIHVEDLFFLDDLKNLGVPWVTALAVSCQTHEDVRGLWALIRSWGPDGEDVEDLLRLDPKNQSDAEKLVRLTRVVETWSP